MNRQALFSVVFVCLLVAGLHLLSVGLRAGDASRYTVGLFLVVAAWGSWRFAPYERRDAVDDGDDERPR